MLGRSNCLVLVYIDKAILITLLYAASAFYFVLKFEAIQSLLVAMYCIA